MVRGTIAAVATAMLIAGCGGGSEGTKTSTESAVAKEGGTLTVGTASGISQLDPHTLAAAQQLLIQPLLFNGLTTAGPDGTTIPDLAEKWTSSDDLKTWTFNLRSGVKFHNGTAFDSTAAKANLERILDPKVPNPDRTKIESISEIETPDPETLVLTLSAPNALLPDALASATIKMIDPASFADASKTAVGTGPFKLKEMVPDDHVTLVKNTGYWGKLAKLDEIDIVRSPDTTAAGTAFRAGDLDILWSVAPADVDGLVAATSGTVLEPLDISGGPTWEVDNTSPPFNDVRARQALMHAIDRKTMLKVGYAGKGIVSETASMLSPKSLAYDESLATYPFDLDKAKSLFAAAGVDKGSVLTFYALAGQFPEFVQMGQVLQQDLKKIGITLEIKREEFSTWLDTFYPAGQKYPGGIIANYLSLPTIPSYQLSFLTKGVCECNADLPGWDALLDKAVGTKDEAGRNDVYAELQKVQNDEVPVMPIAFSILQTVAKKGVVGAWVDSQGNVNLEQAGFSK